MSNLSKMQIKTIIAHTDKSLIGKSASIFTGLGAYHPKDANWGYYAGYTVNGDLVVTKFSVICGEKDI